MVWYRFNLLASTGLYNLMCLPIFSVWFSMVAQITFSYLYRYQWDSTPLLIAGKRLPAPLACQYCGAPRVFELQLMPPLVYLLRTSSGVEVELGTVLVYTCSKSCWQVGSSACEEYIYVQSEPEDSQLAKWSS